MKKRISGRARALIVAALLCAMLVTIFTAVTGRAFGSKVVQTVLSPFRAAGTSIVNRIERVYDYIFKYESLQSENRELKARIIRMEENARTVDQLERENERLAAAAGLVAEHPDYKLVDAYLISWDVSNWKSAFTISKGTRSGIRVGQVAVTEYRQVVGLVTEAGPNWATVTTVLDSSLGIGASVSSTGDIGMVEGALATGAEGLLRMNYLPTDSVLKNNEQVLTTGSTVYPRGLIIGYITDAGFDETGVAKYAILRPAADLNDLEQVFIIKDYNNQ